MTKIGGNKADICVKATGRFKNQSQQNDKKQVFKKADKGQMKRKIAIDKKTSDIENSKM